MKLLVKKLNSLAKLPVYAHETDAGMDIFSFEEYMLKPNERHLFKTGIAISIPENHVALVWDKSGLAVNNGIKTMAGVIDEAYRGEVQILIINLSNKNYLVQQHQKIAQLIIQCKETVEINEVNDLNNTDRGQKGFGSTGLN
ncbi:MAG: dUTP diphosphatase [Patescibacteria group bacterium]